MSLQSLHPALEYSHHLIVRHLLSGRCKGLSLLHHVGDENSCFRFPRFTARMRRFRRYLEAIAWFNGAGWLTLNGKFEAPFQDVGRFNSRRWSRRPFRELAN